MFFTVKLTILSFHCLIKEMFEITRFLKKSTCPPKLSHFLWCPMIFLKQKSCWKVFFQLISFLLLYNIIFRCFSIAIRTYRTLKNSSFEIIHQKRRRVISNADKFRGGLMNYIDTKVVCRHLNILACKGILGQVFIRVYRLKIWTVMLVFWSSFVNCCPSNLSGSTIPPPSLPCVNKYTVQCIHVYSV
jgi:hypothetical protein